MIHELLFEGHENPVSMETLKSKTGMNEREVFAVIAKERSLGYLICSAGSVGENEKGYYIGRTRGEMERTYCRQKRRALSILTAVEPFRRALQIPVGQISLDLEKMATEGREGIQDGEENEVSCKKF